MEETTNYDMFKFREDNRKEISNVHVRVLVRSITHNNMLKYKPILVNSKMEVLDGQHRLLAAKEIGVPIFYEVEKDMDIKSIISLQTQKAWTTTDYINAYAKNGYEDYIKLSDFCKKNELSITVALSLIEGRSSGAYLKIRNGEFKFNMFDGSDEKLGEARDIISAVEHYSGKKPYLRSSRLWKAMFNIIKHPYYNHSKMLKNLEQLSTRFGPRANYQNYIDLLLYIHNFRNGNRIVISADTATGEDD